MLLSPLRQKTEDASSPIVEAHEISRDAGTLQSRTPPWVKNKPVHVFEPESKLRPAIFASPHSGRCYPKDLLDASRLDPLELRRSEDSFVDEIFADAPRFGAPLLCALFPRVYIDPNREPYELDQRMFADRLPSFVNTRSPRVAGGLGTIARVVSSSMEIYRRQLTFAEARHRLQACYAPYHAELRRLIRRARQTFGAAILIDCHSMPSREFPSGLGADMSNIDIVIGDRFGAACAPAISSLVERLLLDLGYRVSRNTPYAGGYTTIHYGRPSAGVHALQIEINRAIYMDENRIERAAGLAALKADMSRVVAEVSAADPSALRQKRKGKKKGRIGDAA